VLRGRPAIAKYLGQPVGTVQRWVADGMPVQRQGRYVTADREELNTWLARESRSPEPFHIVHIDERDLTEHLRRGLRLARKRK
jgi:excisionase family DNA binding protein